MLEEYSLRTRHRGAPAQSSSQNKRTFRNDCMTCILQASDRRMGREGILSTPHPVATDA